VQLAAGEDIRLQRLPITVTTAAAFVRWGWGPAVGLCSRWCALVAEVTDQDFDDLFDERVSLRGYRAVARV
jgi:hypothetical protein